MTKDELRPNPFAQSEKEKLPKETRDRINFYFEEINNFSEENENFDMTFVESLAEQWLERGTLSLRQFQALENIYDKWVNK